MEREYIKIAEYADFKGKTKQAIYQSKKIKKTILEDGTKVIMFADLPAEELNAVNQFLEECLSNIGPVEATIEKGLKQADFDALQVKYDALEAEHIALKEQAAAMAAKLELQEQLMKNQEQLCEALQQLADANAEHAKKMEGLCEQANILMLQKIPNSKSWNPRKLLPWNWGKPQEEI